MFEIILSKLDYVVYDWLNFLKIPQYELLLYIFDLFFSNVSLFINCQTFELKLIILKLIS